MLGRLYGKMLVFQKAMAGTAVVDPPGHSVGFTGWEWSSEQRCQGEDWDPSPVSSAHCSWSLPPAVSAVSD